MKRSISDLAGFGGTAAFGESLHVGRPNIGDRARFLARVERILDSRWFANDGPIVREFESRLALATGAEHVVAMCNATLALELVFKALDLKGEVIVPSFTFIATVHALKSQGLTPVFCDIDPSTHCADVRSVEGLVGPRTAAILAVHVWGRPCEVADLQRVASVRQIPLVFDAAHAFGCSAGAAMIGTFGVAEVFSFHATKFLNSFEGGAVATRDGDLARHLRRMRNFGFIGYDAVEGLGTNAKMTEIAAAMGLTNLEVVDRLIDENRERYHLYRELFADVPAVRFVDYSSTDRRNYQYVVLEIDPVCGLDRDEIVELLHAENVLARRYFYPGCHRMEPYRTDISSEGTLPMTERVAARVLVLPTGGGVDLVDIRRVATLLRFLCEHASDVRRRLDANRGQ